MILTLCLLIPTLWVLWTAVSVKTHRNHVRQLKVPTFISPVNPASIVWALVQSRVIPLLKLLPFGLGSFTRYNRVAWTYYDKYHLHQEVGDVFVHVNPGETELYIANAETVYEVCARKRDFPKPLARYEILNVFGKNVDTVEGHDWQRHRKYTAPAFNERKNHLVWLEALRQAVDMRGPWFEKGQVDAKLVADDLRTLSLHVLSCVAFGTSHDFGKSGLAAPTPGHSMTFREVITTVYSNFAVVILLPHRLLSFSLLPKKLAKVGRAVEEYKQYMHEMLDREKQLLAQRAPGTGNLISLLARSSEESHPPSTLSAKPPSDLGQGLTDSEVMGNVFIYTLAGHETTANVLSDCMLLLAISPECQDWVREELQSVLPGDEGIETWDYERLFPRLKRCLALMLESLRLFHIVPTISKYTADRAQELTINGHTHIIPTKTVVELNVSAVQTHPRYWGDDSLLWRPSRWITSSKAGATLEAVLDAETVLEPTRGSYLPWSEGARSCPGRKFAQVEFVAVMAVLFRGHRATIVPNEGESIEEAQKRTLRLIEKRKFDGTVQEQQKTVLVAWSPVGSRAERGEE